MAYFSPLIEFLFNSLKDLVLADVISSVGWALLISYAKRKRKNEKTKYFMTFFRTLTYRNLSILGGIDIQLFKSGTSDLKIEKTKNK